MFGEFFVDDGFVFAEGAVEDVFWFFGVVEVVVAFGDEVFVIDGGAADGGGNLAEFCLEEVVFHFRVVFFEDFGKPVLPGFSGDVGDARGGGHPVEVFHVSNARGGVVGELCGAVPAWFDGAEELWFVRDDVVALVVLVEFVVVDNEYFHFFLKFFENVALFFCAEVGGDEDGDAFFAYFVAHVVGDAVLALVEGHTEGECRAAEAFDAFGHDDG